MKLATDPEMSELGQLLYRRQDDPMVADYLRKLGSDATIEIMDQVGFITLKKHGIEVAFKKSEWLMLEGDSADPASYLVEAIHVHAGGHDGYGAFKGSLPGGVIFGDDQETVQAKLGPPDASGGGNPKSFNKSQLWPRWKRYHGEDISISFTFSNESNRVVMATISGAKKAPD